eukprot:GHVU01038092.1.p8 GENE.GHVU01038092.1~~GHVU01038092.1.p8  ORF type:complete len:109 (+),score=12.30 GHVU01038092.1:924-1250(+)
MNAQVYNWETVSLRHGKREVRGHARVHAPTQTGNEEASNQEGKVASRQGGKQARWQAGKVASSRGGRQAGKRADTQTARRAGGQQHRIAWTGIDFVSLSPCSPVHPRT